MKNILKKLRNPKVLKTIIVILVAIATIAGILIYQTRQGRVGIENSLVSDTITTIAPTTPGKLVSTSVYESEKVRKGDPIAVVDGNTLYAATDGLIIMANNQIGSIVSSQNPVAQMIDPSQMRIAGTIDENKGLADIRVGQVVSFTVDALPGETFWGYVDEISPSAKQTQATFS